MLDNERAFGSYLMSSTDPICAVLLATCNGECWLPELLDSLATQKGVELRVIVSDDLSSDRTMHVLRGWQSSLTLTFLPSQCGGFGSANRNFLRMFRDADIGEANFVALADQDDIWRTDKLSRAIGKLRDEGLAAYSSDFEAFWPDGRTLFVKKSHAQKPFDYLFSSPGPGCTFVLSRAFFLEIRGWIISNFSVLTKLWMHDWIIYAYARSRGYCWLIDHVASIRYRQHMSNEIGVNFGVMAIRRRLEEVKNGRYRHNAVMIAELTRVKPEFVRALRRLSWVDRLWLIWHANWFRRSVRDVWALRFIFLLMPATPIPELEGNPPPK